MDLFGQFFVDRLRGHRWKAMMDIVGHFSVERLKGHHREVAMDHDSDLDARSRKLLKTI